MVSTKAGAVRGVVADGVLSFKGIPFAAPPVGDLRWRAPRPAKAWTGVRPAAVYGSPASRPSLPAMRTSPRIA